MTGFAARSSVGAEFIGGDAMRLIDPVCGMRIDPGSAAATRMTGTGQVYFCSVACADQFDTRVSAASKGGGVAAPAEALQRSRRAGHRVMLASFVAALALLALLVPLGVGWPALSLAAGVLVVSCIAVCVLVAIWQGRALRDIEVAARELTERRRSSSRPETTAPRGPKSA